MQCVITELDGLEMSPREGASTLKFTLTTRYLEDISNIGTPGLIGAKGTQVASGGTQEVGGPIILGALSREHMDGVIDEARPLLQECLDAGRLDVPDLYGKAVLKFTVGAGGDVTQASVKSSTMGAPEVEACMVGHIKPLVFDRPAGGGIVIASYPFEFPRSQ